MRGVWLTTHLGLELLVFIILFGLVFSNFLLGFVTSFLDAFRADCIKVLDHDNRRGRYRGDVNSCTHILWLDKGETLSLAEQPTKTADRRSLHFCTILEASRSDYDNVNNVTLINGHQ